MGNMTGIVRQLKQERDRVERQLSAMNAALAAFVGTYYAGSSKPTRKRRKLSAKALANIRAAQKKRWAKVRAKKAA
jgi:predicted metalloendopeptidase